MKTSTKVIVGALGASLLVGGLAALTRGFTNWEPSTWLDQWKKEKPTDSEEDTKVENGKMEMLLKGGPKFAASASVGDAKSVTVSIVDNSTDKRIAWSSSDPTKVEIAKSLTDSGEDNTIKLKKLFAGEVKIKAFPALLSESDGVEITVTYDNAVERLEAIGIAVGSQSFPVTTSLLSEHAREILEYDDSHTPGEEVWLGRTDHGGIQTGGFAVCDCSYGDQTSYVYFDGSDVSVSPTSVSFLLLRGYGREGAEALPSDIGNGTIDNSIAAVYLRPTTFVMGNECLVGIQLEGAQLSDKSWIVDYKLGEASYDITVERFVAATSNSIQVDRTNVEF